MTNPDLRSHEPPEVASINSEGDTETDDELFVPGAGRLNRSRSGSRRRSIQRSKSSRTSRRTQKTAGTTIESKEDEAKVTRNSSSISGTQRKREPIYLN